MKLNEPARQKLERQNPQTNETNDWVQSKINSLVGLLEPLLATVKRQKLARFGCTTHLDSLSKTILQGRGNAGWTP